MPEHSGVAYSLLVCMPSWQSVLLETYWSGEEVSVFKLNTSHIFEDVSLHSKLMERHDWASIPIHAGCCTFWLYETHGLLTGSDFGRIKTHRQAHPVQSSLVQSLRPKCFLSSERAETGHDRAGLLWCSEPRMIEEFFVLKSGHFRFCNAGQRETLCLCTSLF